MTTTASSNPYVAPRAAVQDAAEAVQPVRIFSVSGRIGRARYICYTIFLPMLIMALAGVAMALLGDAGALLMVVAWVAVTILSFMLTIQRSHDFDMSGWMALLLLVPLANFLFWFAPGTDGANRFGGRTPPNGTGVLIGAWLLPVLFVAGIVAAISLPAYQDYVKRAQQSQVR